MNLAPKQPAIVAQLAKQMATYKPVRNQTDCPEPAPVLKHGKKTLSVRNDFPADGKGLPTQYVEKGMSAAELSKYECLTTEVCQSAPFGSWWGDFFGPCCRPKAN